MLIDWSSYIMNTVHGYKTKQYLITIRYITYYTDNEEPTRTEKEAGVGDSKARQH